jgi:cell wall-associated NlpC family hydrolase
MREVKKKSYWAGERTGARGPGISSRDSDTGETGMGMVWRGTARWAGGRGLDCWMIVRSRAGRGVVGQPTLNLED